MAVNTEVMRCDSSERYARNLSKPHEDGCQQCREHDAGNGGRGGSLREDIVRPLIGRRDCPADDDERQQIPRALVRDEAPVGDDEEKPIGENVEGRSIAGEPFRPLCLALNL
jgi:hypothetical protein